MHSRELSLGKWTRRVWLSHRIGIWTRPMIAAVVLTIMYRNVGLDSFIPIVAVVLGLVFAHWASARSFRYGQLVSDSSTLTWSHPSGDVQFRSSEVESLRPTGYFGLMRIPRQAGAFLVKLNDGRELPFVSGQSAKELRAALGQE